MGKFSKILICLIISLSLVPSIASAEEKTNTTPLIKILNENHTEGLEHATISFVDENLLGQSIKQSKKSIGIKPMGQINEVYSHSSYTYAYDSISQVNSRPTTNNIFLESVAKGMSKSYTNTSTNTGSVSIGAEVTGPKIKIINLKFTGNYTGSWSKTDSQTYTFSGPPESSSFNSRDYYSGTGWDTYSAYLYRYDVYKVYNGNSYMYDETVYVGIEPVVNVYVPKQVIYSVDTNR